jgi:hypothetical protein
MASSLNIWTTYNTYIYLLKLQMSPQKRFRMSSRISELSAYAVFKELEACGAEIMWV